MLDDNREFLPLFLLQLKRVMDAVGMEGQVAGFSEVESFEGYMDQEGGADVVFLDILLPEQNGVRLAGVLQAKYPRAKVVFMSAVAETASDIFEVSPSYFLLKPISDDKLNAALSTALQRGEGGMLALGGKGKTVVLEKALLEYIECQGRILSFHTCGEVLRIPGRLSTVTEQLGASFLRCHKSFTVNLAFIRRLEKLEFVLASQTRVPISRKNAAEVKAAFFTYLGRMAGKDPE